MRIEDRRLRIEDRGMMETEGREQKESIMPEGHRDVNLRLISPVCRRLPTNNLEDHPDTLVQGCNSFLNLFECFTLQGNESKLFCLVLNLKGGRVFRY